MQRGRQTGERQPTHDVTERSGEMKLHEILDDLKDTAGSGDVKVGELLDAFSGRSLGVLITLFSVVAALPIIGALPGASIATGVLIIAAIGQSLFADGGIWAPQRLRDVELDSDKIDKAIDKSMSAAKWVDHHLAGRLTFLTEGKLARGAMIAATAFLAVLFFPLALLPGAVTPAALATLAFGLALMSRDGLIAAIGYGFTLVTLVVAIWLS
ncbi:exopolysaccharide biosynthesis protein [Aliishimia ponticola]|uniref:Exopolysaccharide biosynthesis protein n=1 Tax=Aliishimia ponticola TaxID=2499833 RepID=A0A4S4NF07_9RHOB|nr:exopolysaccharide biosynthesis protein [Aliishimia ponticola]THH38142.1 exopolysaccharide biosynthesis protein [Aliishimia ponticola]